MGLTYTVRAHETGRRGHGLTYEPIETTTGVVWSPGPLPETVWVLPYSGAGIGQAVVVHAPTRHRSDWHAVEYRPKPPRVGYAYQRARIAARLAPALSRKTWLAALGVTDVAQLALA